MANPMQQTTGVDVDAVPETTVAESRAPAGSAGTALPTVGTNAVSEWGMWDPNVWWTDWSLPPDPRPSWEQWFDWVNQLQALTPALGEASRDWQTMIGQFDDSLRTVQAMRADLAGWTGPSATTMAESLDRLEDSITTKTAAIRDNPTRLRDLAQTISDAVPPMAALDAEYQQVLQDLNACRQVAERGRPIMLNLATELLRTGTDLENSVRTDNLAPQPVPPQPLVLTDGPQGPGQQLTQVAGPANLADPGAVGVAGPTPVAELPTTAGASNLADPGVVTTAGQAPVAVQPSVADLTDPGQVQPSVPGVAVGPVDQAAASLTPPAQPSEASSTLAGGLASPAAPTVASAPVATPPALGGFAPPAPVVATPVLAGGFAGSGVGTVASAPVALSGGSPVPAVEPADGKVAVVVSVPVPDAASGSPASGTAAVPAGLLGRTAHPPRS